MTLILVQRYNFIGRGPSETVLLIYKEAMYLYNVLSKVEGIEGVHDIDDT